jgi:hypothetical protein
VSGDPTWEADNVPVLANQGSGQLTVNTYPAGSDPATTPPVGSQQILAVMPSVVRISSYLENFHVYDSQTLLCCGSGWYENSLTRQWSNSIGGISWRTDNNSDGNSSIEELFWPAYWPDGQNVNGTLVVGGGGTYSYSTYTPTTWGNADWKTGGAVPPVGNRLGSADRQLTRKVVTDAELVTGGPAQPGAFQLIRLLISAAGYSDNGLGRYAGTYYQSDDTGFEGPGDTPIPANAITLLNQPVAPTATNAYVGEMYVLAPAGAVHDLPVGVTGTNANNYSFNIQSVPGLSIYDTNSGVDLTLQTNTVIVGQQMNLVCKTVTTNGPTLTDFQWTVPGFAISNYVLATDSSSANVVTNFSTNNANVMFYWIDGTTNCVVQVSAAVNGKKLTTQATFNILKPSADLLAYPGPGIKVDNNYAYPGYYLHFGTTAELITETNWGMRFYATNINLNGCSTAANFLFVQLGTVQAEHNYTNGTSSRYISSGLDSFYPASEFPANETFWHMDDPPAEAVYDSYQVWRSDHFTMYLFYKLNSSNSIPAPIKRLDWSWSGVAQTNASGWQLITNSIGLTNVNILASLPNWTNNLINGTTTTNNQWINPFP